MTSEEILDETSKPHRRGRPPVEHPWYKAAAKLVAFGTPLRQALWRLGVHIDSERALKNIYRHVRFRHYYERYRWQFRQEWGCVRPRVAGKLLDSMTNGLEDLSKLKI